MAAVRLMLGGNLITFDGPDVVPVDDDTQTAAVVATFLDSIDMQELNDRVEETLAASSFDAHPAAVVLGVIRAMVPDA